MASVTGRRRLTTEGRVVAGVLALLTVAAIGSGNNLLYLLVGPFWVSLLVAARAADHLLEDLEVARELPAVLVAGVEAAGWVTVRAPRGSVGTLRVHEPGYSDVGQLRAWQGGTGRVAVGWRFSRRGVVSLSRIDLSAVDPFGWWERSFLVHAPCSVLVLPRPIGGGDGVRVSPDLDGARDGRHVTRDGDLRGLRAWRDGDALSRVHWPTSARAGHPVVVERVVGETGIVVHLEDVDGAAWETEISRAAGAVLVARSRGQPCLVWFPDGHALGGDHDEILSGLALAEVR